MSQDGVLADFEKIRFFPRSEKIVRKFFQTFIHVQVALLEKNSVLGLHLLALSPPITNKVLCANSLDPDKMRSNSTFHSDPSCFTLRQHFHQL